ncbi:hypothetical protein PHYPO_G00243560 [Pangasianodon hypophthalmus]|uniref:Uncharacterized protein n=1 Tax=Pangasianodon hypophthalmus TaxID=310915 RepID=A0A5N5NF47_PANHP|nr:hypothetical protein PHYPO_G00243560 [Pangasianodon hypophthalmus]
MESSTAKPPQWQLWKPQGNTIVKPSSNIIPLTPLGICKILRKRVPAGTPFTLEASGEMELKGNVLLRQYLVHTSTSPIPCGNLPRQDPWQ